jgi:hypothetical protein
LRSWRFVRWITSNSSSERPEPTATQVKGDSAMCVGIFVSWRIRSSRPWSRDPPPASIDPAVHDVGCEFGRSAVERHLHRTDDLIERLRERRADLLARQDDRLRQAGDDVATADLGLELLRQRVGGADLELQLLSRLLPDQHLVLALRVVDDRLVELIAGDADRLRHDDPTERDHSDLGRAAADVDDHRTGRLADRQPGADRGRHRLLDQVGLARAGRQARLLDRALLDAGDTRWHADNNARVREAALVDLLDEVAQHLLGHVEVGDHAVLERPDRRDRARRAAEHPLGLDPDGVHLAGARVDRHHARLGQHDAAPAHVDERVGRAQIDGHVAAAEPGQVAEETHRRGVPRHGRSGHAASGQPSHVRGTAVRRRPPDLV